MILVVSQEKRCRIQHSQVCMMQATDLHGARLSILGLFDLGKKVRFQSVQIREYAIRGSWQAEETPWVLIDSATNMSKLFPRRINNDHVSA